MQARREPEDAELFKTKAWAQTVQELMQQMLNYCDRCLEDAASYREIYLQVDITFS